MKRKLSMPLKSSSGDRAIVKPTPAIIDLDWLYINGKISETYYKQQLTLLNKEETN